MAVKLIIKSLDAGSQSEEYILEDLVMSIGRSQGCTIELKHNEVSRRHFIIKYEGNSYFIIDEGSTHGTWLNDVKLEAGKNYPLSTSQSVHIPGFVIEIINDHQLPKPEKTTAVARKLMGKLFNDLSMKEEIAFLLDLTTHQRFLFSGESSSFILGRAHHLDFVIEDETIKKEHLSFIRDINGIRAICINDAHMMVNEKFIKDSTILYHGDKVRLGQTLLCFFERDDDELAEEVLRPTIDHEQPDEKELKIVPAEEPHPVSTAKKQIIKSLDYLFFALFFIVSCGLSWLWLKMA